MSTKFASLSNVKSKDIAASPIVEVTPVNQTAWTRPADWLTLPTVTSTDQKFVGLLAVMDTSSNFVALQCTTSAGTYTVDWGDGSSPQTYASGTQANYRYTYASISSSTLSTRGYKQVIVTVTPTTANLLTIDLQKKNNDTSYIVSGTLVNGFVTNWLDIDLGGPNLTSVVLTAALAGPTVIVSMSLLEQIAIRSVANSYTDFSKIFYNAIALRSVPMLPLTRVTTLADAFNQCFSLTEIPPFSTYTSTANITSIQTTFRNCFSLTDVSELTNGNYANVTTIIDTFNGCRSLKTIPYFNTSKVTSMLRSFANCNGLLSVANLNTSNVSNMSLMFNGATLISNVPNFDTIRAVDMGSMFAGCTTLTAAPNLNMSNATSISAMFSGCTSLNSVPVYSIPKVTNASAMFQNCTVLPEVGGFINTSNLQNTQSMFQSCTNLITAPAFDNTSNVTNMSSMFQNASKLNNISQINTYSTSNVANMQSMFNGCASITTGPTMNTINVTNASSLFQNCSQLLTIPTYDFSNVTTMASTFGVCGSIVSLPLLNTVKNTSLAATFASMGSLVEMPAFNTSNVTTMAGAFFGCTRLSSLPAFDTSKVTNMITVTQNCNAMAIFPAWNTANVTSITSINTTSLASYQATNTKVSVSFLNSAFSKEGLENMFTNLGINTTTQTVTITGNPGSVATVSKTGTATANSNVITIANTVGLTTGMVLTSGNGFGVSNREVKLVAANSQIQITTGLPPANGMPVSISSAPTTVGGYTQYQPYYVANSGVAAANSFQISTSNGGGAITFTGSGQTTANVLFATYIDSISTNVSVTLSNPANAGYSGNTYVFRALDVSKATLKNWTVTG
jgi:surface protein